MHFMLLWLGNNIQFTSNYAFIFISQIKKVFPDLHFKLPGKRLLGNNFDPGIKMYMYTQTL